jgi:hypothetical protein
VDKPSSVHLFGAIGASGQLVLQDALGPHATSHWHELTQSTCAQDPEPEQLTSHAPFPQSTESHEPVPEHSTWHESPSVQSTLSHELFPVHWITQS